MRNEKGVSFLFPIRDGENVRGLFPIVAEDLVKRLDFNQSEQVNQTFIPDNLRKQESDILYLVPFRSEDLGEVLIYVSIEHQSTGSPVMGFRVLFCMLQMWDTQRSAWQDNKVPERQWRFRPIITDRVVYTKPKMDSADGSAIKSETVPTDI